MANTVAELVFIPAPGVGHIMSTVEIAKLLVNRDQRISITVLVIKPPPSSGSGSAITTYIESLANKSIDRISFIELPQDETPPSRDPKHPMNSFEEFINCHCKYVRKVVADMMSQPGSTQVSGFVIDMFCTCMIDVANEFNVPTYVFFTSNAAFLGFQMYILSLCDDHNRDVVGLTNSDTMIPVSSFVKPVPTNVFPLMIKTGEGLNFVMRLVRKLRKAKGIMVNTFLELETHAIKSLSSDSSVPFVYPVGPLLNLEGSGKPLDDDVKRWLDGQPPSSVVFLCFGSMGSFEEVQVKEIAHGLERSGHRFVWSLRRPPVEEKTTIGNPSDYEDPRVVLPEGFMERTAGIGKVIGWAPQDLWTGNRIMRCNSSGDLYPIPSSFKSSYSTPSTFVTVKTSLWHARLGHPGPNIIKCLRSRNLISSSSDHFPCVCSSCELGKQNKLSFSHSMSNSIAPFDIIHSDV